MDDYSDDEDDCPYTGNNKQEDINIDSEEEKENSQTVASRQQI
jgi:hypothetical protein